MVHDLKILREHFQNIVDMVKTFEIRSTEDRVFKEGDRLRLREWEPADFGFSDYTGREVLVRVLMVHTGFGMQPGFACLAIELMNAPARSV